MVSRDMEMDLHEKASFLVDVINQTLDKQAPLSAPKPKSLPRWWTEELGDMKKELRRLARLRRRRPADAARYQELRSEYQRAMQKACKDSFRKFCSSASSVKELSGMVKALSTPPPSPL